MELINVAILELRLINKEQTQISIGASLCNLWWKLFLSVPGVK